MCRHLRRQCELDNATLHRDLSAALEKILNHKLQLQVGLRAGSVSGGDAATWVLVLPAMQPPLQSALRGRMNGCTHQRLPQADLKALCGRESAIMQQLQQEAQKLSVLPA